MTVQPQGRRSKKKDNTLPPQVLEEMQEEQGTAEAGFWEGSLVNLSEMCEECTLANLKEDCPPECLVIQAKAEEMEDQEDDIASEN